MKRSIMTLTIAVGVAILCTGVAVAGSSPTVSTGAASKIADTSATLGGTVNPLGTHTSYQFEYGLTNLYGVLTKVGSAGSGTKAAPVTRAIGGLIPGTVYHYKLLATNKYGTTQGADRTFKTGGHAPPVAATGPSTGVHRNSVTLTGTVNPNGEATSWAFQYGLTGLYGQRTFSSLLPASNATSTVTSTVSGLEPGVLFHYRLIALHGTTVISTGADETFFTLPDPTPTPKVTASTTPRKAKHSPYVLTTRATVAVPSSIPASLACFGNATIKYLVGNRQVAFSFAPMLSNCTFSATTTFVRPPGTRKRRHPRPETLKIEIHFRGNGYLGPSNAKTERVTIG
jgi:hypothetical protein